MDRYLIMTLKTSTATHLIDHYFFTASEIESAARISQFRFSSLEGNS
jgi:hypothetical protein